MAQKKDGPAKESTDDKVLPLDRGFEIPLDYSERLQLLNILPDRSTRATMKIVDDMSDMLGADEEEAERIGLKATRDPSNPRAVSYVWDKTKDHPRPFIFKGYGLSLVVDRLKQLDKDKKIERSHLSLWEKFVLGGEEGEPDDGPAE